MKRGKIKVVWLCHLSNAEIRRHLTLRIPFFERIVRKLLHSPCKADTDFAVWNTNAIREFEHFTEEVDLYVVAPFHYLKQKEVRFDCNGIHYFFFQDKPSYLLLKLFKSERYLERLYAANRKRIVSEINRIRPDIVHLIGAENPSYGLGALDLSKDIPLILQLQTLLGSPGFQDNYFMHGSDFQFRCGIERRLIGKADYIGTTASSYVPVVKGIKPDAVIVPICLALTEGVRGKNYNTEFDFVYFASSIDKAADLALEAFAIAHKTHPDICLDIVGGGSPAFVNGLQLRIKELELTDCVFVEGRLETHDDVINQIRKSRFALLPLKVDLISGTIREAMANGLPVLTTVTPSTPKLNKDRECILLSETGDHPMLAKNMCRLLDDADLARQLSENALLSSTERKSNRVYMTEWKDFYHSIL